MTTGKPDTGLTTTLDQLVPDYLASCVAKGLAPATIQRCYGHSLTKLFLPWCADQGIQTVDQLTERVLDRFTTWVLTKPHVRGGNVSRQTAKTYINPVRWFLNWAATQGEDVQALPRQPKVGKRHKDVLSREEIERMEHAAVAERDRLVLRLFADCGLRLHELTGLRVGDLKRTNNRLVMDIRGKGDRERRVPVPSGLINRLARHLKSRPAECVSDRLFVSVRRGPAGVFEPLGDSGVTHMVHDLGLRAGLDKNVHPHLLRHSWMTEMLRRGMNPIQLSVIAGASQGVIAQHYAHLNEEDAFLAMTKALSA
jgi:integrase/recombinase XerD